MIDDDIFGRINALSDEEEHLWQHASDGHGSDGRGARSARDDQGRARPDLRPPPSARGATRGGSRSARSRGAPAEIVESYQQ